MPTQTQHGYLLLADITGYTSYLAGVELDHAHEILTDLLETIVAQLKPVLHIAKLEGDAVFAYAPETAVQRGECLLELVESTYTAFRDRAEAVQRRTTCECNACRNIPALDLKFLIHHGNYIVQTVSGIHELVGSDVNLVHRLLKNHVGEATGWRAYALFTERGLEHMRLHPESMHRQVEAYEHLGAVTTHSTDLRARYATLKASRQAYITPETALIDFTVEYAAPPPVLWDWLNDPQRIVQWSPDRQMQPQPRAAGRTDVGARNHCVHGKRLSMIETILDWRPFDYFTVYQDSQMLPGAFTITHQLTPTAAGARLRVTATFKSRLRLPALLERTMGLGIFKGFGIDKEYVRLAHLIAVQPRSAASLALESG
jgi:uncharacterized protein YndB with AHSA1/START domain